MLGYLCKGFRVRSYVSGWPSAPPYHVPTATLLDSNMLLQMLLPAPSSLLSYIPSCSHDCFYRFTCFHALPSPCLPQVSAHLETSTPTSFLDSPNFAKLPGAILNVWSVDKFQEVHKLLSTP